MGLSGHIDVTMLKSTGTQELHEQVKRSLWMRKYLYRRQCIQLRVR
jgi:hypothetical protein